MINRLCRMFFVVASVVGFLSVAGAQTLTAFAVDATSHLIRFSTTTPGTIVGSVAMSKRKTQAE